jgi:hypothetical protein
VLPVVRAVVVAVAEHPAARLVFLAPQAASAARRKSSS